MTIFGVIIITWPIEIGRHQADRIKAILFSQSFAEIDPSNLSDAITLIRRLQWPGEQRFLLNRLLGKFGVNATATQKQQAPHT